MYGRIQIYLFNSYYFPQTFGLEIGGQSKSMFETDRFKLVGVDTQKSKDRPSHVNIVDCFGILCRFQKKYV